MCALLRAFTHFNQNLKVKKIKIQKYFYVKKNVPVRTRRVEQKTRVRLRIRILRTREMYRLVLLYPTTLPV